ncbi:MAG: helix-turn-helix domain-containing protein [Candidatus Fimenecus sp.]
MNESTDKEKLTIFGKNLKLLRTQQNISQEEFADKTKLDRTYISGLERGKRNPSFLTLIKLAQTLNIPVEKLFYGEKNDLN